MAATSCPIQSAGARRSGRPHVAWLLFVALAAIALLVPTAAIRAAEPDTEPWEAAIVIQKWLDRDGDLSTDSDIGWAGSGWEFSLSIVGADADPIVVTTDEEGWAEVSIDVATETAELRVTELTEDGALLGAYADNDEDRFDLPITDRGVTVTLDEQSASFWALGFINEGVPVFGVTAWVDSIIDKDGDLETLDGVPGAHWVYDLEVSGTATVDPATVDTGRDGDEAEAWIELTDPTTTLRVTQRARDGYELLDAYAIVMDDEVVGTLDGRTLTVEIDANVGSVEIVFINHQVAAPSPTPTPGGSVQGATGTPGTTLPPTDAISGATQPGTTLAVVMILGVAGLVCIGLLAMRPRRMRR
jgi:hypothetical protein